MRRRFPIRGRTGALLEILREWARRDFAAGANWAAAQTSMDFTRALAAVFNAAGENADRLQLVASELASRNPARAADVVAVLVHALGSRGDHARAASFAVANAGVAGHCVIAAYSGWAASDPEAAMISAGAQPDAAVQRRAFEVVATRWARSQPQLLADYALRFPPGPERDFALVQALRHWVAAAPDASLSWVQHHRETVAALKDLRVVLED
jgi:hypothetical protein